MSSDYARGDVAIRAEGLGKRYLLPHRERGPETLRHSVIRHLKEFVPFLREEDGSDYFWALRDASFELSRGQVLGIIGRNGSGKSTLLKVLSRVTTPTVGRVDMYGRVGSLLEVGTGFHPEMTGRQNIFMSGALLGASQREIRQKLEEIIDYAGIETFIDMPVKRYSSGMYVRLAYAVTSLLRSDILILDEVLAVGDLEFQKKTQKNVESVAHDGRTVVFVSHSMQTINKMCQVGMWMQGGKVMLTGDIETVTNEYMADVNRSISPDAVDIADADPHVDLTAREGFFGHREMPVLTSVETLDAEGRPTRLFETGEELRLRIGFRTPRTITTAYFCVLVYDLSGEQLALCYSCHEHQHMDVVGTGVIECAIPDLRLHTGDYSIMLDFGRIEPSTRELHSLDCIGDATAIRVKLTDYLGPAALATGFGQHPQRSRWALEG